MFSIPTLAAWPLRGRTALKSILWETLFLDQLRDFSLLSLNSFLQPFSISKFMKKNRQSFTHPEQVWLEHETLFLDQLRGLSDQIKFRFYPYTVEIWNFKAFNLDYSKLTSFGPFAIIFLVTFHHLNFADKIYGN